MSTERDVLPGVVRLGSELVNFYLLHTPDGMTLVDAGFPAHYDQLLDALAALDRAPEAIAAVVLTHGHGDHLGVAERLRADHGVEVWAHEDEVGQVTRGERPPSERPFEAYLDRPALQQFVAEMQAAGGMAPPAVAEVRTFADGDVLGVPGRPEVIATPGHSPGHVALHVPSLGALFVGDALGTYNVANGHVGPSIPAAAFNVSSADALDALDRLAGLSGVILPGHGEPWADGAAAAVAAAKAEGPS